MLESCKVMTSNFGKTDINFKDDVALFVLGCKCFFVNVRKKHIFNILSGNDSMLMGAGAGAG